MDVREDEQVNVIPLIACKGNAVCDRHLLADKAFLTMMLMHLSVATQLFCQLGAYVHVAVVLVYN